jgi:hypothetical protein
MLSVNNQKTSWFVGGKGLFLGMLNIDSSNKIKKFIAIGNAMINCLRCQDTYAIQSRNFHR